MNPVHAAVLWTPFGGVRATVSSSEANAISNRGWVVGAAANQPALWLVGRRLINLPTPSDATGGPAYDVNDTGQIVGSYSTPHDRHSVLWIVR